MLSCVLAARLLSHRGDGDRLAPAVEADLDAHVETCASCREALAAQRAVATTLRARPADPVPPLFARRVAERLDRLDRNQGWIDIADWRVWTVRLAPAAAVFALAAWLTTGQTGATPLSLEEWAVSNAETSSVTTLLWDSEVTSEALVEQMLTGDLPAGATRDGR
jgi:predicted anti-sigma-YlaC factor YlaD